MKRRRRKGQCRKVGYLTKHGAEAAIKRLKNSQLNAYFCKSCQRWHTGNSNNPLRIINRINELLDKVL